MPKHFSYPKWAAVSGALLFALTFVASSRASAHYDERDVRYERYRRVGHLALAVDFDYGSALSNDVIEHGGGGALRIGSEHDLFLVSLIPELTLDYHRFGTDRRDDASVITGKVGGRIRFLKIVEPGVFAHLGIGNISSAGPYSRTGLAFDMGATLDLTIIPLIDLGLHAAWNRLFGGYDSGTTYFTSGAHVALVL